MKKRERRKKGEQRDGCSEGTSEPIVEQKKLDLPKNENERQESPVLNGRSVEIILTRISSGLIVR